MLFPQGIKKYFFDCLARNPVNKPSWAIMSSSEPGHSSSMHFILATG